MRRALMILVLLATAAMAACDRSATPPKSSRPVTLRTSDGFALEGRLFGVTGPGVVLSHMRPSDQTSWFDYAEELSARNYVVLTFNFRGYGRSQGSKDFGLIDRDVRAAFRYLLDEAGVPGVVLVGASMGGTASLIAPIPPSDPTGFDQSVRGVATLSAPTTFAGLDAGEAVSRLGVPKLYIAATGDAEAAKSADELFGKSAPEREIKLVPGGAHGTEMLVGKSGAEIISVLNAFIARVSR